MITKIILTLFLGFSMIYLGGKIDLTRFERDSAKHTPHENAS